MFKITRNHHLVKANLALFFFISTLLVSCDYVTVVPAHTPAPRAGTLSDGSARWAFDLAREKIESLGFSADNELYLIRGVKIWNDGRLSANCGNWSFDYWNERRHLQLKIDVSYDGEIKNSTTDQTGPPASRGPIPANWSDSTEIFHAAPAFSNNVVVEAMTNTDTWPGEPGVTFWNIGCILSRQCPVHYVRWDGVYLGNKFP